MEKKAARANVPTWEAYFAATQRENARNMLLAFAKIPGEEAPARRMLSEEERGLLVGDTPEQRERDADTIARYEAAHGTGADLDGEAEKAYQKLRGVGRSER